MIRTITIICGFIILLSTSCIKENITIRDNDKEETVNNNSNKEDSDNNKEDNNSNKENNDKEDNDGNEENSDTKPSTISMEKQVVEIVNNERAKRSLAPLLIDESLMKSCDIRAKETVTKFSHERPDGTSCYTVIEISYSAAGENIAYGQESAEAVMSAWMNSEGHRNNILSEIYTHIGVGCYESGNNLYWVQLFARKK